MHKLAEQGEINLLDPVTFYLPEFGKKGKRNITIHQILGHRGGIPGLPVNMPLETIFDADGVWQLLCEAKPIAADGAKLAYHAITGGFVLQRILEKVTGRTIADYLDEHFRKPMSMKYFTYGLATRHRPQVATNYATGPGMPLPLSWIVKRALGASFPIAAEISNSDQWMDAIVPAANIYATAEELCRFYQMLLDGGCWQDSRLLDDTTVKRATQALGGTYIDRTLLIPMRYSAGLMLGGNPIGIYGRYTRCAFCHIGLINKFSWADRERQISVTLLTSGLCLLSHHLPALGKILAQINKQCMPE
jgi:CubicO group peptidase (beta-lactamase class C family)